MQRKSGAIWLARDKLGRLAVFEPGSSGPIPESVGDSSLNYDTLAHLLADVNRADFTSCYIGHIEPGRESDSFVPTSVEGELGEVLAFVSGTTSELQNYSGFNGSRVLQCDDQLALVSRAGSKVLLRELENDGRLRASFWLSRYWGQQQFLASIGLYCYVHLSDGWIAGPYGCKVRPASTPDSCDELMSAVKHAKIEVVELDLDFDEHPRLQLAEFMSCRGTELGYLKVDGELFEPGFE